MSTIRFTIKSAPQFLGNLGAPLEVQVHTGDADDARDSPEEIHFSDDPFSFGLSPEDVELESRDQEIERPGGALKDEAGASGSMESVVNEAVV